MKEELDMSSKLSSQQIFEHLKNDNGLSGNPKEIIKKVNTFYHIPDNELSEINNEYVDIIGHFDYTMDNQKLLGSSKIDVSEKDLDTLLDELINDSSVDDINLIKFDENHTSIFELETPIKLELIEKYQENDYTEEEIFKHINSDHKKNGNILQKTVKVFELYESNRLYFKDDAKDLSNVIINKLITFIDIIIDFDGVLEMSDTFLKYAFDELCKYMTPKDIIERIDIVNIEDSDYVKIIKTHIPNSYKFWKNNGTLETNVDFTKIELIKLLDPDSKLLIDLPEQKVARTIPFERITANSLGNKREKKLRYPVYFVENITEELIKKFEIDSKVLKFIELIAPDVNEFEIIKNNKLRSPENYIYQIPDSIMGDTYRFVENVVLESCTLYLEELKIQIYNIREEIEIIKKQIPKKLIDSFGACFQTVYLDDKMIKALPAITRVRLKRLEELEFDLMDREHKYIIKEDILRNIFEIISFSNYSTGLDKLKLISYHYICRYYDNIAQKIKDQHLISKVRGHFINLEMFKYDLVNLLCVDDTMRKFMFTMRELAMKWVTKYAFGNSSAKLYFDILMITPEVLSEMILKYLALTIIKNKNPMTLRAIYSSYISLIHTMLYAEFNFTDFSKKKYGYLGSLNKYADPKNDKMVFHKKIDTMEIDTLLKLQLLSHPEKLNENYHLLRRLNISKLLEFNTLHVLSIRPKNIGIRDWLYFYARYFTHIEHSTGYKINSRYIKSDKRSSQIKYITILVYNYLEDRVFERVMDMDCTRAILDGIIEDISMRTLNRGYLDNDFNLIVKSNHEYLEYIDECLKKIAESLE